jgi:hypothetical protein
MTFKKTEKEIIRAIVKYGGDVMSLADVLNKSHLLEKRGIAIIPDNTHLIYLKKNLYQNWEDKEAFGYIADMVSLISYLIDNRLLITIPFRDSQPLVIGKEKAEYGVKGGIVINDGEGFIVADKDFYNWYENDQQAYWPCTCSEEFMPISKTLTSWISVSQELKELVMNDFKTEEQIRFDKQQRLTWISIIVAGVIGICSIIIGVVGFIIR